jgi:hypothetical protein
VETVRHPGGPTVNQFLIAFLGNLAGSIFYAAMVKAFTQWQQRRKARKFPVRTYPVCNDLVEG